MKVGDYVRTRDGYIDKITDIRLQTKYTKYNTLYFENKIGEKLFTDEELKEMESSSNIIDLIEVGDVIKLEYNGVEYICDVCEYMGKANCLVVYCEDTIIPVKTTDESVELKSIVTHEQFSQMEYRIGD